MFFRSVIVACILSACSVSELSPSVWVIPEADYAPPVSPPTSKPAVDMHKVGALADGILRVSSKAWYVCGEELDEERRLREAARIAYRVVSEAQSLGVEFDLWGVVGTMANESGFDRCAFGLKPRQWAVSKGLLNAKGQTISYSELELLPAIRHPDMVKAFAASGFDLGLCQVLSKFYLGEEVDMLRDGIRICLLEMQNRARMFGTTEPWEYWRGEKTAWYKAKIEKWVRRMKGGNK